MLKPEIVVEFLLYLKNLLPQYEENYQYAKNIVRFTGAIDIKKLPDLIQHSLLEIEQGLESPPVKNPKTVKQILFHTQLQKLVYSEVIEQATQCRRTKTP